jgi:hypothetical protein
MGADTPLPSPADASAQSQSASPAPPQPSPQMRQGTQLAIRIVNNLRTLAKAFPGAAPAVAEMHNQMREVMKAIMQQGTPGTAAAPPTGG